MILVFNKGVVFYSCLEDRNLQACQYGAHGIRQIGIIEHLIKQHQDHVHGLLLFLTQAMLVARFLVQRPETM